MARKPLPVVPQPFNTGDVVCALANTKHVPEGSVGRVATLSATGHPIVDFTARGRVLITAAELVAHDGPLPKSNPDRVPLRDEPMPREIVPVEEPPAPDWCEPPDPALLKRAVVVQMPKPVWQPAEDRTAPSSALRNPESRHTNDPPATRQRRNVVSEEGREAMRQARLRRAERERAEKAARIQQEQERENVEPTTQPTADPTRAAVAAGPHDAARADAPSQPEQAPAPGPVALVRPNRLDAPPDTLTIGRLKAPVMIPVPHEPHNELAQQIVSTRRVLGLAATRGLGSRTVLDLARLLCQLDDEHMTP